MNTTLFSILNGIATDAKAAGDGDSMSVCSQMVEQAARAFGTTYDASTTVASPVVILENPYPAASIPPSYDSAYELNPNLHQQGN